MKRIGVFLFCLAVLCWAPGGGERAAAQDSLDVDGEGMVSMDFDNVDIRVVIKYISDLTGKNFIIDTDVRGTVTVISPTKIPLDEVYKVFESILEVRGFVAVPSGKVIKVSTKRQGTQSDIPTRVGDNLEQIVPEDTIVTQLIPLQYAAVEKIRNALGQLFSKDSSVIAYPTTNTLIVTDVSSNIHRLVRIIKELDVPGYETKITVAPLRYAAADTLAAELSQVIEQVGELPGDSPPTPRRRAKGEIQSSAKLIKIIPDERTNSLIILANEEDTKKVLDLIKRLDVETERTRIHVHFLKNASAEDVAKILSTIVGKRKPKGGETPPLISEDKATNALIIDATQEDFASLQKIIQRIDIIRDQVLVEVLIAEVSYEKSFEVGVEWKSIENNGFPDYDNMGVGRNNAEGFGGSTFEGGGLNSYLTSGEGQRSSGLSGLSIGFVQKVAGSGSSIPDFAVLLHALATNDNVNILATPQILTMENEEAEIKVVQNIPYLSKIEESTTSGQPRLQNIEYKDVGITLKITPRISIEGLVRLEIEQEISSLTGQQVAGLTQTPVTFIRETKTSVMVKDNHTIVISGLVRDDRTDTEDKIPILGDIPLVGNLFRTTSNKTTKLNLLVFITPRVVKTTQQIADLTNLKRHQMEYIDLRLAEKEEETAAREYELQEEEKSLIEDLKARYGSPAPADAEEEEETSSPEPAPEAEALPEPVSETISAEEATKEAAEELEEAEDDTETPPATILDMLPKVSFKKKDKSSKDKKPSDRFHH